MIGIYQEGFLSKTIKITLVSFLLFSTLLSAQNTNPIVGNWTLLEQPSFQSMSASVQDIVTKFPHLQSNVLAEYSGRYMTFNADGTYVQGNAQGAQITGTWSVTNNQTLLLQDALGHQMPIQFVITDTSSLIFYLTAQGDAEPSLSELHFLKN